jgi:hypothetical protein
MLIHCTVLASVDVVEATRNAETGCPQDSVFSPLPGGWNGPSTVRSNAQQSINFVEELCGSVGVGTNEMLAVIPFTKERKFKILRLLYMEGALNFKNKLNT